MNLSTTIKQLWRESKATPVFTALYIGGVTFAVGFTMLYAILIYINLIPIYPEYNRDTTLFLHSLQAKNTQTMKTMQSMIGAPFIDEHLSDLKNCEYVSVMGMNNMVFVQHPEKKTDIRQLLSTVDENFFKLYEYKFVAGEPFTQAEADAGTRVAVITDRLATTLFGSPEAAVGRDISIESYPSRIRGVVKEGSSINDDSYSHIFTPLSIKRNIEMSKPKPDMRRFTGGYSVAMKVSSPDKIQALKDEIQEKVRRINAADTEGWNLQIMSMPSKAESTFGSNGMESESFMGIIRPYLIVLLVLLVIPAMNISGMISGQMNRRMAEIGLRRSFGANRSTLCRQVLMENLFLTLLGGLLGLILVWLILILGHNQIFGMLASSDMALTFRIAPPEVTAEMLFTPVVFIGTLAVCLILNILSAYIPVRMALRRPIVSSLNNKR